nr:transporter substrate-binding domain-containing protein [Bacteriovorax sp. HI3]
MKWSFILALLLLSMKASAEDVLPVYVFEIRPLIYQDDNKEVKGEWLDGFEKLSKDSGIKFHYQFVSIPRLEIFLSGKKPGCNLTLLRTKAREKMNIQFIYDHPVKTIFKVYQRGNDIRRWNLKDLSYNKKVKIITNTSVAIDILKEKNIEAELLFNLNSIVHMLLMKRVDLVVGSNLAIEKMPEFHDKKVIVVQEVKTLSHGIGCSQATAKNILDKLQKSARKLHLVF